MTVALAEVALLCAPTMRSRAYVQALCNAGLRPSRCFLLPGAEPNWHGKSLVTVDLRGNGNLTSFSPGKPLERSLGELGVACEHLVSDDINSHEVLAALTRRPEPIVIYSGRGGAIVRPQSLAAGKRFLHVHGGYLPEYRGSTAFYFSILKEGLLGASAIWLDEGIDTGPLIARRQYPIVPGLDIDLLGDPLVRADLLVDVLRARLDQGTFPEAKQDVARGTDFYVIHPVLKHIALRRCQLVDGVS